MSLWDNVKKFAAPYSDDDYDDYDEDEEDTEDEYEEEEERPARRSAPARRPRAAAPVEDEPEEDEDSDFGFGSISASGSGALGSSSGFNGPVLHTGSSANKQEVVLFRPGSFNDTSKAADDLRDQDRVEDAGGQQVEHRVGQCVRRLEGRAHAASGRADRGDQHRVTNKAEDA